MATPNDPFQEPWLLEVDLCNAQQEGMTTAIQAPTTTPVLTYSLADTVEPPHDIAMAINLHLHQALEQLQWASPAALAPVSQCSLPRREPPSAALGAPASADGTEDPLKLMGMESSIIQMLLWVATPNDAPSFTHIIYQPLQLTLPQTREVAASPLSHSPKPPLGLDQPDWLMSSFS